MRRISVLIPVLVFLAILTFNIFTKADRLLLTESEALEIGKERYLEFLWIVDGAFNNSKFNEEFIVNGKKLNKNKFICKYKNKKSTSCEGENFEEEFTRIFASNISYNKVYGDGVFNTWIKYEKGKYIFNVIDSCSISRMNTKHSLSVKNITSNKLSFYVDVDNKKREFVLINENNLWKVSRAYYHDICEMDYNIE